MDDTMTELLFLDDPTLATVRATVVAAGPEVPLRPGKVGQLRHSKGSIDYARKPGKRENRPGDPVNCVPSHPCVGVLSGLLCVLCGECFYSELATRN